MLPRSAGLTNGTTQSSFDTQRTIFNSGLSSLTGIDRIADIASISELSNANWPGAGGNAYVEDGIHLSKTGYSLILPAVAASLE